MLDKIGPFERDAVTAGDCRELIANLPHESIDVLVTSPPYWGQRLSKGFGVEDDPRDYIASLVDMFAAFLPKLKATGIVWLNIGDAYNTRVNWRLDDRKQADVSLPALDASNIGWVEIAGQGQSLLREARLRP